VPRVAVVAHRGFSGAYPENTASAFAAAIRLGVEMIEFDVRRTLDDGLVCIHDPTVDRTSDGTGTVAEMPLAALRELDAGGWLAPQFAGERFVTLQEALDLMPAGVRLNVHVKAGADDRQRVVPAVAAELARRGLLARAFIASDQESLVLARRAVPELVLCNLSVEPVADYVARSAAIGCRVLQPGNGVTTPELVAAAHRAGMEVNPFYADDPGEMRRLIECGVDGILTNWPDRLQRLQRARVEVGPEAPAPGGSDGHPAG